MGTDEMRFKITKTERQDPKKPHRAFLWRPARISPHEIAWLETVERRLVVDNEGNYAGGYRDHWEYAD